MQFLDEYLSWLSGFFTISEQIKGKESRKPRHSQKKTVLIRYHSNVATLHLSHDTSPPSQTKATITLCVVCTTTHEIADQQLHDARQ